jgi:uncharacterized sulfatase
MPHLIYGQRIDYMFQTPTTQVWKKLYDEGSLKPPRTYFWEQKPAEELYDLESDPSETRNLVDSPDHRAVLDKLRKAQREHALAIRDAGFLAEAEFHRRAGDTTIYEMAQDPARYPLERILDMAERASSRAADETKTLIRGLDDGDSGVRYWAAMGLLIRGPAGVESGRPGLRAALADESPAVRLTAARALGEHGSAEDLALVLPVLRDLLSPETNGAYASILALNVVEALGARAAPLMDVIRSMPQKDPKAPGRPNGYVSRLVTNLTGK